MTRRFRRWPGALATLLVIALFAAVLRAWLRTGGEDGPDLISSTAGGRIVLQGGPCEVLSLEDGNTLLVSQGDHRFRVRLIAIALPQGADDQVAKDELSRIAPPGPASIELDKRRAAPDGSWLAYVYVDDNLVNARLLATGRASYEVYPGDSFTVGRQLREAQNDARRNRRGIWQDAE